MAIDKVKTRFWDVARCTYRQLLEEMEVWRCDGGSHYACFCDGNGLPRAWNGDEELKSAYEKSDAVCADGIALDWLARMCGGKSARLLGPKLFPAALEYGIDKGWRHFFYGTDASTLAILEKKMTERFPGVKIVGTFAPEFVADPQLPPIKPNEVDILWVALGCPKQEKWCARHKDEVGVPILMPVGAAFDFHSGKAAQTPEWINGLGLCWLWRLLTGGRRVFFRNLKCVSASCWILAKELVRLKVLKRGVCG